MVREGVPRGAGLGEVYASDWPEGDRGGCRRVLKTQTLQQLLTASFDPL